MGLEREVVGLELFAGLEEGAAVEQDRAQDGAFGVDAGGESAFEIEFGGGHGCL